MTPQAADFVEKARRLLNDADTMLRVSLHEAAGRTAYLAAFSVAQALIFENNAKVAKTHNQGFELMFQMADRLHFG